MSTAMDLFSVFVTQYCLRDAFCLVSDFTFKPYFLCSHLCCLHRKQGVMPERKLPAASRQVCIDDKKLACVYMRFGFCSVWVHAHSYFLNFIQRTNDCSTFALFFKLVHYSLSIYFVQLEFFFFSFLKERQRFCCCFIKWYFNLAVLNFIHAFKL